MIMGLSAARGAWARLLPYVSGGTAAIVFDNRGTGRSSGPVPGPADDGGMAADALSVLDEAGERAPTSWASRWAG
jgi:pimeloyl-ACP methyl ester carboxylesterase